MSREILWTKEAAKDIEYWKKNDAAISKRIAALIESRYWQAGAVEVCIVRKLVEKNKPGAPLGLPGRKRNGNHCFLPVSLLSST
jgi:hypothetical protein